MDKVEFNFGENVGAKLFYCPVEHEHIPPDYKTCVWKELVLGDHKDAEIIRLRAELDRYKEAVDEIDKAYPVDIFTEPGPDDFCHLRIGPRGISERLHGSWGRHLAAVIRRRVIEMAK